MQGWIKLHRKLLGSPIFDNPDLFRVWIWCLLKANHKERNQLIGLQEIKLKEGQFITGRHKGSEELQVNPSTFYKYLKTLEKLQMIELNSNNKMTLVTIINWEIYQDDELCSYQQNNNGVTTKKQQNNTNKNDKNVKNDKKNIFDENSIEFRLANYLYQYILKNNPNHKKPNLQVWAKEMERMIRIDKRNPEEAKILIEFTMKDPFWKGVILSAKSFRDKYDALTIRKNETINQRKIRAKQEVKPIADSTSPHAIIGGGEYELFDAKGGG